VLSAFDGKIWVYKVDGTVLDGFPVILESPRSKKLGRIMATPSVADLNGDGIPEIVCGSNQLIGGGDAAGPVGGGGGRGNNTPGGAYLPNWPMTMTSLKLFPVVSEGIVASQALADFDGDGKADIVIQGNGSRPLVMKADPGPQQSFEEPPNRLPVTKTEDGEDQLGLDATSIFGESSTAYRPDVMFPLFSHPSVGDLDMDGTPDVIATDGSLTLAGALAGGGKRPNGPQQQLLAMWSGKTGRMLPGSPVVIEDYTFLINHAVADVNGDDFPEVITGSGAYFLHAADACGREPKDPVTGEPTWPKFTNGWITSTPSVGDIDGDGAKSLEVVTATRTGWLFAWKTQGKATGVVQWESFHHDNANTGNLATKLDQGGTLRAASALDCSVAATGEDQFDAGGCGCKTVPSRTTPAGALGAMIGLALLVARRRR
jgi:MYXO-CTERM domain-containing protein